MFFCHAPQTNIDVSPQGVISPCCKFQWHQYNHAPYNVNTHSLDDYLQHPVLQQVKQEFDAGTWPQGCDRCRIEEENGIASKRQLDILRWHDLYEKHSGVGWLTGSIAFGNTCNLACITCGPWASSRWNTEYQERYKINIVPHHFYKNSFVQEFVKHVPDIVHLDIPGGEPFLSGISEQLELLTYLIDQNRAHQVSLHYTTNATTMPDSKWWDLWQHFKEIDLQISIDGIEDKNSYIRFPSVWNDVYSNIKQYQKHELAHANFRLSVSHTVSAYNVFYIPRFIQWCRTQGLPRPWLGRVHNPIFFRPSVWPSEAKIYIINHLTQSQETDCEEWINLLNNSDDSQHFADFVESVLWHDTYRGLDFRKTFPELAEFL